MNSFTKNGKEKPLAVAFFPTLEMMSGNPYWGCLARELENLGLNFIHQTPPGFDKEWLIANKGRVDILHLHYCQPFYWKGKGKTKLKYVLKFGQNLILARLLGYNIVFTLHNLIPTYWLEPKWVDWLGHFFTVQLSESIIVHCNYAKHHVFSRYFRIGKTYIVEHPNLSDVYNNEISKDLAREKIGLSSKGLFVFTFLGGIRPNKGLENLIHAFNNLEGEKFRLVIAGEPNNPKEYAQNLRTLAGNDNRILFDLRYVPDDELQVFLNAADVIVLPFSKILTSGSAHLAMSFGKPIIAPKMGCLPELIEPDCGWLFEPGDIASLTAKLMEAASSDIQKIGRNAWIRISPNSFQRFAEETLKVYTS